MTGREHRGFWSAVDFEFLQFECGYISVHSVLWQFTLKTQAYIHTHKHTPKTQFRMYFMCCVSKKECL